MDSLNTKFIRGLGTPPVSSPSINSTSSTNTPRKDAGYHPYKRSQGGWLSPRRPRAQAEGQGGFFFWSGNSSDSMGFGPHLPRRGFTAAAASGRRAGTSGLWSRKGVKFQYRMLVLLYVALGCVIPYYVMKHADQQYRMEEQFWLQEQQEQQQQQQSQLQQQLQEQQQLMEQLHQEGQQQFPSVPVVDTVAPPVPPVPPERYKRQAFFQDVVLSQLIGTPASVDNALPAKSRRPSFQSRQHHHRQQQQHREAVATEATSLIPEMDQHVEALEQLHRSYLKMRQLSGLTPGIKTAEDYKRKSFYAANATQAWINRRVQRFGMADRIAGTKIQGPAATQRFRQLMDAALNKGRWVYEADRDYPDFGGATGWNKKKKTERDRDPAIDRPPFPEAGKYHWEPSVLSGQDWDAKRSGMNKVDEEGAHGNSNSNEDNNNNGNHNDRVGWYSSRVQPSDFCRLLGERHLVLIGDMIHWQLHDAMLYNMFDNPQACYGDLACHLGVGHPLCPLPHDVRMKFVRNDLLSTLKPKMSRLNETKAQNPVEMSWLRDLKLKDTVILGATHFHPFSDGEFRRRLTDVFTKIRRIRPDTLVIYRNRAIGHPHCPSKANNFNMAYHDHRRLPNPPQPKPRPQPDTALSPRAQQLRKIFALQQSLLDVQVIPPGRPPMPPVELPRWRAQPLESAVPVEELLHYPLDWVHAERQNQMAKMIVEAAGGIYWNVATMTDLRPDGHRGDQDCLLYRRPGPTDEWAVSLYNLFRTIEQVEQEFSDTV
ncbi:hypothetical protein DFQ26_008147 [Actinomortierella ambigua]|nr:hypothetical protein DFQ26_008147 [Actinomortierella ambigua]